MSELYPLGDANVIGTRSTQLELIIKRYLWLQDAAEVKVQARLART